MHFLRRRPGRRVAEQADRPLPVPGRAQRSAGLPEQRHEGVPLLHLHWGRVACRARLQKASRR
jgi:hypothetical protein